jgi:hypothetical protein
MEFILPEKKVPPKKFSGCFYALRNVYGSFAQQKFTCVSTSSYRWWSIKLLFGNVMCFAS